MAEYKIVIEAPSEEGKKKPTAPSPNPAGNSESSTKKSKTDKGLSMLSSKLSGVAVYGYAKSMISGAVAHEIGMVELKTGSRALQQEAQFAYDIANRSFNILEGIAFGAMIGGPAGAAVAIGSSVSQALSYTLDIVRNEEKLYAQQSIESQQRRLWDIRSGVTGSRSSALARGL